MTTVLARAAGFSSEIATSIGREAQLVDDDERGPYRGTLQRLLWHFPEKNRPKELWNKFEYSKNINDLGQFIHVFQDSFSHAGYGPVIGHGLAMHNPDDTSLRPELAMSMAEKTYNKLIDAAQLLEINKKSQIKFNNIKKLLYEYITTDNIENKQNILLNINNKIDIINNNQ